MQQRFQQFVVGSSGQTAQTPLQLLGKATLVAVLMALGMLFLTGILYLLYRVITAL